MALRFEVARGEFSALGGLPLFEEAMGQIKLKHMLKDILPDDRRAYSSSSFEKIKALIHGFIAGADCLDDMQDLATDQGFTAICGGLVNSPTRYGSFLRSFLPWQVGRLNEALVKSAFKARKALFHDVKDFILDVDSTVHQQYAKKMEGVGFNYNSIWGLDSLQAFDQFGFQYWMDVRRGGTFSSNGAPGLIRAVFKQVPKFHHRYLRGDSAFCNFAVFNACLDLRVKFVITMRSNMYEPLLRRVTHWRRAKNIKFKDGSDCEIGSCIYYQEVGREPLRVVFLRSRKRQPDLFESSYDYAAWVTNIGEHQMQHEDLVLFYRGRGNAENFIRELKNGFDIHHFPCQKLSANKVYGILAAIAHNLMRLCTWILSPNKPRFSKMIRFRMVNLAGQVVKKARYWIIRLSETHYAEVQDWLSKITKISAHLSTS